MDNDRRSSTRQLNDSVRDANKSRSTASVESIEDYTSEKSQLSRSDIQESSFTQKGRPFIQASRPQRRSDHAHRRPERTPAGRPTLPPPFPRSSPVARPPPVQSPFPVASPFTAAPFPPPFSAPRVPYPFPTRYWPQRGRFQQTQRSRP